jgi:hypothetical protein
MLAAIRGRSAAIAGQIKCPFDLNAWRILPPPKLPTSAGLWRFFSRIPTKTTAGSYVFEVLNSGPPETFGIPRLSDSLGF